MYSKLYQVFNKTLQNDDDAEWTFVVAASMRSAEATSQRKEAFVEESDG